MKNNIFISSFLSSLFFLTFFFISSAASAQNNSTAITPKIIHGKISSPSKPVVINQVKNISEVSKKQSIPEKTGEFSDSLKKTVHVEGDTEDAADLKHETEKSSPVVNETELSSFETYIQGKTSSTISTSLTQLGYDLFNRSSDTFIPLDIIPVSSDYLLAPGDEIRISLWGQMNAEYSPVIDRDGKITLPQIGVLHLTGLSFSEAKKFLKKELSRYYKPSEVKMNVSMGRLRSIKVFVVGKIKRPGSYTLSSFSTLINAIFAAGGPTKIGSMRDIQVRRKGKIIAHFDFYDFLLKGNKTNDIRLMSEDVVFIPTVGSLAGIAGNVKVPAIYEFKGEMTLKDLVDMAGGVSVTGYLQRIQVERIYNNQSKIILDINYKKFADNMEIPIKDGDVVKVFPILDAITNPVELKGNFLRPGVYEWKEGLKVKDLIKSLNDLMPDTFLEYALIERTVQPDGHKEYVSFSLNKLFIQEDENENIELMPYDQIVVFNKNDIKGLKNISLKGAVNREGEYEYRLNMKVSDLFKLAGGLTRPEHPGSYMAEGMIIRLMMPDFHEEKITFNFKKAIIDHDSTYDILLTPGDRVRIFDVWELSQKREVTINGSVKSPGTFKWAYRMRVSDILNIAGGLSRPGHPGSYMSEGMIIRLISPDAHQENITFNLKKVLKGNDPDADILLHPGDDVRVFDAWELSEKKTVTINGAVNRPGAFQWVNNMRISDLLKLSGGTKYFSYINVAELTRVIPTSDGPIIKRIPIALKEIIEGDQQNNILLQANDYLFVKTIPQWGEQQTVKITGEVKFPGTYTLIKGETISDVIERAGDFTNMAYLKGAIFTRESVREIQQKQIDESIDRFEQQITSQSVKNSELALSAGDAELNQKASDQKKSLISRMRSAKAKGRVSIRLDIMENFKGSSFDIAMEDGDVLVVPAIPNQVQVLGAVYNQTAFIFERNRDISSYISMAGGVTKNADSKEIYVLKVDGTAVSKRQNNGFFKRFMSLDVDPGDTIVVPEKLEKIAWLREIKNMTQILYQIAVTAGVILVTF